MRSWQAGDSVLQGSDEVGDPDERQISLRLAANGSQDDRAVGASSSPVEQGGLAQTRLAKEDEQPPVPSPGLGEDLFDCGLLTLASQEHRSNLTGRT
jgi:hypothetical protein